MPLDLDKCRVGSILNLILPGRVGETRARRNAVVVALPTKDRPNLVSLCPIWDVEEPDVAESDVEERFLVELVGSVAVERAFIYCAAVYEVALGDREAECIGYVSDETAERVRQHLSWRMF